MRNHSAWSIRLPFESDRDTSKYHWLILKSVSLSDRAVKRMAKTIPSPLVQTYKVWAKNDIHKLIGEMMTISKEKPNQHHEERCIPGSQLETAVDRYD